MTKPNLSRMYHTLLETYWMETECLKRSNGYQSHRCYELVQSRESKLCSQCLGFITLKKAMRLTLEIPDAREDQTAQRLQ